MGPAVTAAATMADRRSADPSHAMTADTPSPGSRFAERVLELDEVLALVAAHAVSSLGRRHVGELAPRGDDDARAALARCAEMAEHVAVEDAPPMAGVTDPLPEAPSGRLSEDRIADRKIHV